MIVSDLADCFGYLGDPAADAAKWWDSLTNDQRQDALREINELMRTGVFSDISHLSQQKLNEFAPVNQKLLGTYLRDEAPFTIGKKSRLKFGEAIRLANAWLSDYIYDERPQKIIETAETFFSALTDASPLDQEMVNLAKKALSAGRAGFQEEAEKIRRQLVNDERLALAKIAEQTPIAPKEPDPRLREISKLETVLKATASNLSELTPVQAIIQLHNIHADADEIYMGLKIYEALSKAAGHQDKTIDDMQTRLLDIMLITSKGARNLLRSIGNEPEPPPQDIINAVRNMSDHTVSFRDIVKLQPHRFETEARLFRLPYGPWPYNVPIGKAGELRARTKKALDVIKSILERGITLRTKEADEIVKSFQDGKPLPEKYDQLIRIPKPIAEQVRVEARRLDIPVRDILRKPPTEMKGLGLTSDELVARFARLSDLAEERYFLAHDFDEKDRILDAFLDLRVETTAFLNGKGSLEDLVLAIDRTEAEILGNPSTLPLVIGGTLLVGIVAYIIWKKNK